VGWPPAVLGGCAAGEPGTVSGGLGGRSSESRPLMRRPALRLSSRCPKNGSAGDHRVPEQRSPAMRVGYAQRGGARRSEGPPSAVNVFRRFSAASRRLVHLFPECIFWTNRAWGPPALGECSHRALARLSVAVRRRAIFVVPDVRQKEMTRLATISAQMKLM
jgi:hypothetical protein